MNEDVYALGREQFRQITGYNDAEKDEDGFLILRPTAKHVDEKVSTLTTSIDDLESQLKKFRAEKAEAVKYQKTEEYKESKKKSKEKKSRKKKQDLLAMVFNNADALAEEEDDDTDDEEEDDGYRDKKKRRTQKKAPADTTLDTTYGKRFSPVVSMLYDSITDFDKIAADIEKDLATPKSSSRTVYRASQVGNLLNAKGQKLSAIKELASVAKQVSDLEYRKEKDEQAHSESNTSKEVANFGAKYLRGVFDLDDDRGSKKGKKNKKDKTTSAFKRSARGMGYDDEDEENSIRPASKFVPDDVDDDQDLAKALAEELIDRKGEFSFSPHEKHLEMEGKFDLVVACDPSDPDRSWKFMAVNPKSGKEIKGFKDDYKDLMPRKKDVRMKFAVEKKKATDLNTGRTYKLVFTD